MAVDGRTHDPQYRNVVQLYEFAKIKAWTRRSITPSDIDGRYFIHSRKNNSHLWLELFTSGTIIAPPQLEALDGLLVKGPGRDCLILAEHPVLQPVNIPGDVVRYALRMWDAAADGVVQTRWFNKGGDKFVGWWIRQWFAHAEDAGNGHFLTAFRQAAGIYKFDTQAAWKQELVRTGNGQ